MPQYLSLKVAFIGYNFAGKKTQAELIAKEYGLHTYQLNDLVGEALALYEQNPEPFAPSGEEKAEEAIEQHPTMSEDSEEGDDYSNFTAKEDFRLCGEKIAQILKDGQEISDEVYVQLYVAKLRLTYPHYSKKKIHADMIKTVEWVREQRKKIAALEKELDEIKNPPAQEEGAANATIGKKKKKQQDPAQIEAKIEEIRAQIEKSRNIERNGWILVDFPSTYA